MQMRIVNPSFGLAQEAEKHGDNLTPTDWSKDPIAIISNSKPNAQELLQGVRSMMGDFRSTDNIDYLFKDSAAQPAPAALIDQIAANYKGAIVALAD
jgi:hypothetical protein